MSSPGALGFYAKSAATPPSTVTERRWKGVNWGGDGSPESFGASVLERIRECGGDLKRFLDEWVVKVDTSGEKYPLAVRSTSENDLGNTAYCYVLDVERRRLDVFGTYVAADGMLLGSVVIDAAGVAEPPTFEHLKRPRGWRPEDDRPSPESFAELIEESIARHSATFELDAPRARAALVRASELEEKVNPLWRRHDMGGFGAVPSLHSFWHAANEYGIPRSALILLIDRVANDIVTRDNAQLRFILGCDPIEAREPKLWPYVLNREASPEEHKEAMQNEAARRVIAEPYLHARWTEPFFTWAARASGVAEVEHGAPLNYGDDSSEAVQAAVQGVLRAHSLSEQQLIEGFGELFEELLLLETWQSFRDGEAGDAPEEWLETWNPVVVGGSCSRSPPDARAKLGAVDLIFSKREAETWPHLVLFRADGARAFPRPTPFSLAKQGPRKLGDTKAVLRDLFVAVGTAVEGAPVQLDDRGVVSIQRADKWEPILFSATWWLRFLRWVDSVQS